jgi:membrane protein
VFTTVRGFVQKLNDDRIVMLGSLLAWGILNTLLPLMLCILALAGLVLRDPAQLAAIEAALLGLLPPQAVQPIEAAIQATANDAGAIGLIGLGFLLWNGTNFFLSVEEVVCLAYHVPRRDFVFQRVIALGALLAVTGLLVLASFTATLGFVSNIVLFAAFLLLYTVMPNRRQRWQQALPGALVASVLFLLILRVWPLYVALFGSGFSVYLAFGTLLLFLFWLWLVGLVIAGCAELNAFLEDPTRSVQLSRLSARGMDGRLELPGDP